MALSGSASASVNFTQTSALDLGNRTFPVNIARAITLASGTGAGQADVMFTDTRTLTASNGEDLDLVAGSLTDAFGTTITIAKLKLLMIYAAAANTNNVNLTRPASLSVPLFLAASDGIAVLPGGIFLWAAPGATTVAVAAGTDIIRIDNSAAGTSVTYDVVIIGTSA